MASGKLGMRSFRWGAVAVYTAAIFALAPFVPALWKGLTRLLSTDGAGLALDVAVPVAGLALVALVLLKARARGARAYLWLGVVLAGYVYLLTLHCEYPVERVHLIQYCLLGWLYFRAVRLDASRWVSTLCAACAVLVVGATDELVQQFVLENRSGTWADVVTNWSAGGLGLVGLAALQREGDWTWYARRGALLRFALGYGAPLVFVAVAGQQVWTRFLFPPVNLIIITVDCCRADRMSCYGYSRDTTRYVDEIADKGVLFTNMFSQAAWTSPGVVSTLTGLYPPSHGVNQSGKTTPKSVTTLLDGFRERGYKVPNLSYLTVDPNFQNLGALDSPDIDVTKTDEIGALLQWVERNHGAPFAIWYHYRYVHLPYDPPKWHRVYPPANDPEAIPPPEISDIVQKEVIIPEGTVVFSEEAKPWLDALYDGHIRQFDSAFEALRYRLSLHYILRNTLIVITADHGEELLEHGHIGHASTAVHSKHYDETLHIPLVMYCPRLLPGGVVLDTLAQQVDILPTVFELMGWPVPEAVEGRSLVPAIRGEAMEDVPLFAESIEGGYQAKEDMRDTWVRSVRTREWKLITRVSPEGYDFELYDLIGDPGELTNVFAEHPEVAGELSGVLAGWMSTTSETRAAILEQEAEEVRRALAEGTVDPALLHAPEILLPADGATLDYDSSGGAVRVRWTGHPGAAYIIEYHVGTGWHTLKGRLDVLGTEKIFGPLPRDGWKPLYQWNPFRVRVRPRDLPDGWSEWISVEMAPLD